MLKMYDTQADEIIEVTQYKVDQLVLVSSAYSRVRELIAEEHKNLQSRLRELQKLNANTPKGSSV